MMNKPGFGTAVALALAAMTGVGNADPIRNPTAIFAGLDKTTGRIINFEVAIGESVQFGTLQVTPRVCNTRPQTETPLTTSFVEVDELIVKPSRDFKAERAAAASAKESKKIFSGWMFAASPGLHGVEHPVYDVWLVDCKGGKETPAQAAAAPPVPAAASGETKKPSRKVTPVAPAPIENAPIGPADSVPPEATTPMDTGTTPDIAPQTEGAEPVDAPPPEERKKKKKKPKPRPAASSETPPAAAPQQQPSGGGLFPF
jgi:hypothetical protein